MIRRFRWVAWFLLAAAGCAVLYRFGLKQQPHKRATTVETAKSNAGYVDPTVCATCHRQIWETYRRTGMGRSFARASAQTTVEDFERNNSYYHKSSDRYYRMLRKDGKLYQRRHQVGFDGQETNVLEEEIHFIIGSGNHSRTYLHRRPDGWITELPVGWYAENGGFWAMNPGYDRPDQEDFRRAINYQCMFCHNGYPDVEPDADVSGAAPIFRGALPEGIDCQRCHGPGRDHIAIMQGTRAADERNKKGIVNPARLSQEKQLEVCMQCHLETTSFRLPNAILRYTRPVFSYRPGEPLADYVLHFDRAHSAGHDDRFEIASAAYRLRQSACFQRSGGAMVCTTCHNPHDIPRGQDAARAYSDACLRCHAGALKSLVQSKRHTESRDCQGCHMPKRRTQDVVHVVMTDHFIQRRNPAGNLLAPLAERRETDENSYRGEVALYYPAALPAGADRELYSAVAQVRQGANFGAGIPRLEAAIQKYQPAAAEFYFELAEAYRKTGRLDRAIDSYEQAVKRRADFLPAVHGLGNTLAKAGRLAGAAEILRKESVASAMDSSVWNDLGLVYIGLRKTPEAVEALRRALQIDPDFPDANNNLGGVLLEQGDRRGAEAAYRNAIRAQPDMAEAHRNLANLLVSGGNLAEAQYHFRKAIEIQPNYAAAYYDYGQALAHAGRFHDARAQFEAAARADPKLSAAHNALGDMLSIEGQTRRAIESYRAAVAADPGLMVAQANLGTALALAGDLRSAKPYLETAVRLNPDAFEAHLHLGKALALERNSEAATMHFRKAAESPDQDVRRTAVEALRTMGKQ